MSLTKNNRFGITSTQLKILAMALMLLDHLWATIVPGNAWMTYVGRMAFPIFAFQIAEGYVHTSDCKKYLKRLFIFALISEIPFNLMSTGSPIFPFHQNVMFTLLLGLLGIRAVDKMKRDRSTKQLLKTLASVFGILLLALVGFVDYGVMGVCTVMMFYIFRDVPFAKLMQLASMILMNITFFKGLYVYVDVFGRELEILVQGFAVLALIPIWLYNGQKGNSSKALQYCSYAFYPAHMLILYLIAIVI